MIDPEQRSWIESLAYVPEHLPAYVTSLAPSEPFLVDDFLVYFQQGALTFIGYPLSSEPDEARLLEALERGRTEFNPSLVSIVAPSIPSQITGGNPPSLPADAYYRLDLADLKPSKKLRSLLKRARRDLTIESTRTWTRESQHLVDCFKRSHRPGSDLSLILDRLPHYIRSGAPEVFQARDLRGNLVALNIADFTAEEYGFYLFNFRSPKYTVPGASDLLLAALVDRLRQLGKRFVNLGLGINPGVASFKLKWGAVNFLPYSAFIQRLSAEKPLDDLLDALLR